MRAQISVVRKLSATLLALIRFELQVNTINVYLKVSLSSESLWAMRALFVFYFLVHFFHMLSHGFRIGKTHVTNVALSNFFPVVNQLYVSAEALLALERLVAKMAWDQFFCSVSSSHMHLTEYFAFELLIANVALDRLIYWVHVLKMHT